MNRNTNYDNLEQSYLFSTIAKKVADFCRNSIFSKMEKEEEKKETAPTEGETPKKSNRDTFMERYKADYPDDNFEDEEAMYGRMNERNADYDRLRTNDDNFRKLVNEHPEWGGMFTDMMDGKNPIESILGRFSAEDLEAARQDPEAAQRIADEWNGHVESVAQNKKMQEERDANVQKSIENLNAFCEKNGIDEKTEEEIWGKALDYAHKSVMIDFPEEFYDMVYKAMTHDEDVAAAREEGEIAGHNSKVQTQLAKGQGPEGIPPTFDGGQGGVAAEPKPKRKGRLPISGKEFEY